jgi:Na+/H+ antiporter NhaD/arsenite permease-like protein
MNVHLHFHNIIRDIVLLTLAYISWKFTNPIIRNQNGFTWVPIQEVSKLFAGIFITIIPAIAILNAGENGVFKGILTVLQDQNGNNLNSSYFWLTGILSAFLDNAPTYLVFFNLAGISTLGGMEVAKYLMYEIPETLLAISLGAVFMGAMTYIGNAPNFMIKSIAEENKVRMPSFFGYLLLSSVILIPVFILVNLIFI